jgi:septum formation topological specificity factor MinE
MSASKFLDVLFGEKEDKGHILIWELGDTAKESHWFKDHKLAANFVEEEQRPLNIYVGVGLSPKNYKINERCPGSEVIAIPGFWLDLDVADPIAHGKGNLPPNMSDARKFLGTFPIDPTIVINSGHGLQAWWLFKEPWYFDSPEERDEAAYMAKRFIYTWKDRAKRKNWNIDSVHDLARVMRVPGTRNHKHTPVDVKMIHCDPKTRYNVSHIEQYLIENVPKAKVEHGFLGDIVLDEDANPPTEKLLALIDNSPTFEKTLRHKRKDMEGLSPSEYDMSLANMAIAAGWTPQEVVNLLIYHRRTNDLDKKMRLNYFEITIGKAQETISHSDAKDRLQEFVLQDNMVEEEEDLDITPERREEMLAEISKLFGIQIKHIERHLADPPSYYLCTSRGDIMLGTVDNLIKQDKLRIKLAAATRKLLDEFSKNAWRNIAQCLLLACEDVGVGEEATVEGATRGWLARFLSESEETDVPETAVESDIIYRDPDSGIRYVTISALRTFLRYSENERLSSKQIGQGLRRAGCFDCRFNLVLYRDTPNERRTTRQMWRIPRGL